MMALGQDLRLAARHLAKDRGFADVVVLTLALGIAANTTVFTILNGAFLRDLPFAAPDRVVDLTTQDTAGGRVRFAGVSLLELRDWQTSVRTFDAIGAFQETAMWAVTRRAAVHIAMGFVVGTAGALGAGEILEGLLADISGADALTFFAVSVVLMIVALVACLVPARRTTRLDPVAALRHE